VSNLDNESGKDCVELVIRTVISDIPAILRDRNIYTTWNSTKDDCFATTSRICINLRGSATDMVYNSMAVAIALLDAL